LSVLTNGFSWSISRDRIFTECRRAYYFRHYGSWGGWDPEGDPEAREAYILKHLGNRFTFAGKVVHEVVALSLNRHRYGTEATLEGAQETALRLLREGFRQSRDGLHRQDPKNKTGLFEHEYAEPLRDADWKGMRNRVFTCLRNFFASDIRGIILDTRIENWLPIDHLDSFSFEGTKIHVAPDFALRNLQGNALVIDWKTGRPGDGGDRTQLVCYGLFAREKWGIEPRRAIGELHYLLTGDSDVFTLDERILEEGQDYIRRSIAAMRELLEDPASNRAARERFPMTENRSTCTRCNYRRLCWPAWPSDGPGD
jgi:CRISPR/Cas system-associated exonuclease Cas4 (RecB family)